MATIPDVGQIFGQIVNVTKDMVGEDVTTASAFARSQAQMIEQNAILFAQMEVAGEFVGDDERRKEYAKMIEDTALNFANTVRAMAVVEVEKLWNAVMSVVWSAIGAAAGIANPLPMGVPAKPV